MATVSFKKGLLANLPVAMSEGTLYVTTDERALYLDIDNSTRIRIGDFQEFATLAALQANTNPSTTALYYITELNVLAKWNGAAYVQINLDTGATSADKAGDGNALSGVSYDPSTRKLTFTTIALPTAAEVDNKIAAKVGDLKIGEESFSTVKAYVDKKTDGIATDAALETLTQRVSAAEEDINTLQGDKTVAGSVDKKIDDAIKALDLANTYDAKGAADAKDASITAAKKAGDDAQADVDALEAKVGVVAEGKTVIQLIDEAKVAATYDDTALKGRVTTLEGEDAGKSARAIAAEETAKIVAGADTAYDTLKEISDWISSHKTDAGAMNSAILALEAIVDGIGGAGEKATVVAYVTDAIAALKISDYAKAADLTALAARVTAAEGKLDTLTGADTVNGSVAKALKDAKAYTDDKDTAMGTRMDAVEGKAHEHANKAELDKIADGDKAKWDAAQANAEKTAADALSAALTWGSF